MMQNNQVMRMGIYSIWVIVATVSLFASEKLSAGMIPNIFEDVSNAVAVRADDKKSVPQVKIVEIRDIDAISSWHMCQLLLDVFRDKTVAGVILAIDSFGGSSSVTHSVFSQIKKLKKIYQKPVVAYIENQAFSGGYYIACAADYIIASRGASVGSIGVRLQLVDQTEYDKQEQISYTFVHTGSYLEQFAQHNKLDTMSHSVKNQLIKTIDTIYTTFVSDVLAARSKAYASKAYWQESQTMGAARAQEHHLIDEIGSQVEAFKYVYTYARQTKSKESQLKNQLVGSDAIPYSYVTVEPVSHDFMYDIVLK